MIRNRLSILRRQDTARSWHIGRVRKEFGAYTIQTIDDSVSAMARV